MPLNSTIYIPIPPVALWGFFAVCVGCFCIFSVILLYHWNNGVQRDWVVRMVELIYLIGSIVLLSTAILAITSF